MRPAAWVLFAAAGLASGQQTGARLPAWTPGTFDIHQIHTGRGNAALLVFPDSTTMLLDAGAISERSDPLETGPAYPNASRTPAEWIAHYAVQAAPSGLRALDYALVTHYHDDHIAALPGVAAKLPIRVLIDRGDDPPPPAYPVVRTYLDFRKTFGGRTESLRPGHADQIVAKGVAGFEVRNVAANGMVWTGSGTASASAFPPNWRALPAARQPVENDFSLALRFRYGRFRYFTGGDLAGVVLDDGPAWRDLETPVAKAVGAVDAAVLNHHGWLDTTNPFFLRTLDPRVVVIPAWHATHPDHSVFRRLRSPAWKPAPPGLFITSLLDAPRAIFRYLGPNSFKSTSGHVLIRVAPGGESYRVIVLGYEHETLTVRSVHGPYAARSEIGQVAPRP